MIRQIKYNLPGCGLLYANIYPYTEALINFLDEYGHIKRLQRLDQLGSLRDIFPGAHHTRYEYVFLQWSLVTELAAVKDNNLGLNTNKENFGRLPGFDKGPTSADILQCLVLLMNIGYLEGTFAASRAWLELLRSNKKIQRNFKQGLAEEDKILLKQVIDQFDFYKFHIFLAMFMLKRYTQKENGREYVNFSLDILRKYLNKEAKQSSIIKIWELFRNIRRIAFLSLDAFYAPVPFSLDLSSIMMSFKELYKDVLVQAQGFQSALKELEVVLQNTVYLSESSILKTSQATEHFLEKLQSDKGLANGISSIKNCISPDKSSNRTNSYEEEGIDWNEQKQLLLIFNNAENYHPDSIKQQVKWEHETRYTVGKTRCRFGLIHNPNQDTVRLCFGIKASNYSDELRTTLKGVNRCIMFSSSFQQEAAYNKINTYRSINANNLFQFLLKATLGWDNRFILSTLIEQHSSFVGESGKAKFLKRIKVLLDSTADVLNSDQRLEIASFEKLIRILNFPGYMLGFLGSTKFFKAVGSTEVAEFDGVLFKTKVDPTEPFMYILESKNKKGGSVEARKQLSKRLSEHMHKNLSWEIKDIDSYSVYAEVKLKVLE